MQCLRAEHVLNFYSDCISSLRSKRANSKVITVVGIKIDQKYFECVIAEDATSRREETWPGVCSAHLCPVWPENFTNRINTKPTNEVFIAFLRF